MNKKELKFIDFLCSYFVKKHFFKSTEAKAKVTPQATFLHDLGLDSLELIDLEMAIENEYNINLDLNEDGIKDLSVAGLADLVKSKAMQPA